jgi:2-C-methyl-D-erythritol 4-phosphate cytidylyltransferase
MPDSTAAILLAGGTGSRMGSDMAKQFIRVAGKPVLCHSFDALRRYMPESLIVVVAPVDSLEQVKKMLANDANCWVVPGGSSRQASTRQGLQALAEYRPKNVLIHDGARPFVSGQIIHDVLQALDKHEAVDVAIPTTDTIIVERDGFIQNIPKRQHLLRGQTPQAFRFDLLMRCYEEVGEERLSQFTDDCGIYLECHPMGRVRVVQGHEENLKITNPVDLVLADEMFRLRGQNNAAEMHGIDLRGSNALIFGGTAGIGKALTQIMKDAGAHVIARSRHNGCDITDSGQITTSISEAHEELGSIDFIVNTVGLLNKGSLLNQSQRDIAHQISVNLTSALWIAQAGYPSLKETKGMLLQFASSSYTRGRADYVAYSATKAAIVNLTQGLSEEWNDDQIRVNCIVPGRTDTEMRRANFSNEAQAGLSNPYEVALCAAKALSSKATGQILRA